MGNSGRNPSWFSFLFSSVSLAPLFSLSLFFPLLFLSTHSRFPRTFSYLLCSGRLLPSADVHLLSILSRSPPWWVLLLPQCPGEFRSTEGGAHPGGPFMSEHSCHCRDGKRQWHQWEKPFQKLPGRGVCTGFDSEPKGTGQQK